MVFLVGALIATQGSGAVPILIAGLLLSWAAAPGWTELVLMWPDRIGGIAATCAEAFRPYSPVLANLTGVCYWWGWVPTCGFTAILSATALHQWYLPFIPVTPLAVGIILTFLAINLLGVRVVTRVAIRRGVARAALGRGAAAQRQHRFAPRGVVRSEDAVSRGVWCPDFGDGRAVPRRVCRARV